jgi:hypothetical protein
MRCRHLLPILTLVFATAAGASDALLPIPDALLSRYCTAQRSSLACVGKIEAGELSARYGKRVTRCQPHALCINLARSTLTLQDKSPDTEHAVLYHYIAFVPELKLHVIHIQRWEGSQFLAIDHESGRSAEIIGYPVASPDQRRFAAVSMDLFASFSPNGVELWRIEDGRLHREARFDTDWGPTNAKWRNPESLTVDKHCENEETPGTTRPCGSAELRRSSGVWTLDSPR